MELIKQSTAVTKKMGPFVDSTDGNTEETGLTISQADIRLSKNGGAFAQTNNVAGATHDEHGYYGVPLNTTDTATLGSLRVAIHVSGALPVWADFMVVPANVYDSLFSTDKLEVDLLQMGGVAQSATDLKDFADAGYDPSTHKVETCKVNDDMRGTDSAATASALSTHDGKLDTVDTVADAIKAKTDNLPVDPADDSDIDAQLATIAAYLDTEVAAILADTNELQTDWANGGRLDLILDTLALEATLTAMKGGTFNGATDSLEAIRDRGDAAWVTGAGGSDRLLMVDTTIATLASQTSFTLTAGSADDDAYNNCTIVIEDSATATQKAVGLISNYVGATKTVTLKYDPAIFTMAVGDKVYILAENALKATLANRQLNVAADGDIAGNIDGSVASLVGHTVQTGDNFARLGAPAGVSIAADLLAIDNFVDELESRLTAVRAGYLDNLSAGAVALASVCTEARLAELAAANLPTDIDLILADVTGINGDAMRGTDSAALASVCTEARLAELDAANVPGVSDAIKAKTDNLPADPADDSDIDAQLAAIAGYLDTEIAAILADTDELQTDLADGGRLDLLIDAVKAKTDDLPSGIQKNVALSNFSFLMTDTSDDPATGLTVTVQLSLDGAAFANATNSVVEIANGYYKINLTQAEMNANVIGFKATAAYANQTSLVIVTS